jgi:tetratricopeptide (TPR) repeat protein
MTPLTRRACLPACLALVLVAPARSPAQTEPPEVMRDWRYYNNSGWISMRTGRLLDAEQRFHKAIEVARPYSRSDPRLLARSYADLAQVLYRLGRYKDAEPLAKWSLLVRESAPRIKPQTIYENLYVLASIYVAEERLEDAEPLLRRALAIHVKELGPNDPAVAVTLDDLAGVCRDQWKNTESERLYKRALALRERANPGGLDVAETEEHYAVLLRRLNRTEEAQEMEERARAIRDEVATRAERERISRPVTSARSARPPGRTGP